MVIKSFLNYLHFEMRYSPHTVISYQNDLSQFTDYLLSSYDEEEIAAANYMQIRSWLASLMENGMSAKSINRKISSLQSFYKYCLKNSRIEKNPMTKIIAPKVKKSIPVFLNENNTEYLFNQFAWGEGFAGLRDRIVLELLYGTGMRSSELIGLKESDIQFSKSQLKVLGKGNKERIIPLHGDLVQLLKEYIKQRNVIASASNKFLIVTDSENKAYPRFVYRIVNRIISQVATVSKKSPHVLRHTFATHLLNNGAELNAIKELLGHSSLAATQVYTHNSIERLKDVYKKAHPKSSL